MAAMEKTEKFSFPRRNSNSIVTTKRINAQGNFSDVQSDIVINVDGVNFSLHKFPLLSRSGRIRKLAVEVKGSDSVADPALEFSHFPGGPDVFELAAKFCYGINFEITATNVAYLRCAAEYLEMNEDYGEENLVSRTEVFLDEMVLQSFEKSVEVLCHCEGILQMAEEVKIVNRCIDAMASKVCNDQMVSSLSRLDCSSSGRSNNTPPSPYNAVVEWWAEDLSTLRSDLYQRALAAMKSRGLKNESLGGALMHYAQRALKSLKKKQGADPGSSKSKAKRHSDGGVTAKAMEHQQRILVETVVSLLPTEKNIVPTSFLLGLLRTATVLDTTVACRLDLERRIGLQLEQATVDDLLIPAFGHAADTVSDVDIVQRVLLVYLQQEESRDRLAVYESDDVASPSQKGISKVAKLMDMYLAEIATDVNLKLSKFIALAELLPEYARVQDDGLYRAIDIFLKAHPTLSDLQRKKMCKLLDCQKLSQEACAHAAQNERLPVQLVVQVLYFEQLRMRNAMMVMEELEEEPRNLRSTATSPRNQQWHVRRENRELKVEVARLRLRANELERENAALRREVEKAAAAAAAATSSSGGGFFSSVSRRLGKMNPFSSHKPKLDSSSSNTPATAPRRRRHSIS